MIVRDEHLERFVGKGDEFERLIHSLVCVEGWICKISPDQIDWDHRTNLRDGGRDVVIRVGNERTDRLFIPQVKSVWSAKSGKDGLETSTLQKEVRTHPKVISHLKDGGAYIWCVAPAADHDKRDGLRNTAIDLGKESGFDGENQISFFFRDVITSWLKQHLGLIPVYFPDLPHRWETLAEWKSRDKNRRSAWVDFGDRAELVVKIRQHLLATSGNNVLHLAGFSGVGKTRTAQQACEDHSEAILRSHPTEAPNILEARIHNMDSEDISLVGELLSVFDSDQIEVVQRLVRKFGVIGARALANHIIAPYPTADDPMYVPPMTAWLLMEFEADDQVFGRFRTNFHNRRSYFGGGRDYFIETTERMTPYLSHPLRRIREWAQLQLNFAKGEIE